MRARNGSAIRRAAVATIAGAVSPVLRTAFAEAHATEITQLQTIAANARAARQAGQSQDQVRAISSQAASIRAALRAPSDQLQQQVEATLTADQLAWMRSHSPMGRRGGRGATRPPRPSQGDRGNAKAIG